MYAKAGYKYDHHTEQVLGGEKPYSVNGFLEASEEDRILNAGKEIVQFYLQSIDGGYME